MATPRRRKEDRETERERLYGTILQVVVSVSLVFMVYFDLQREESIPLVIYGIPAAAVLGAKNVRRFLK